MYITDRVLKPLSPTRGFMKEGVATTRRTWRGSGFRGRKTQVQMEDNTRPHRRPSVPSDTESLGLASLPCLRECVASNVDTVELDCGSHCQTKTLWHLSGASG